ncbi:uncharacterized protein LOC100263840 isoform X2 [Vitis vinifera]|uniref:uncharacterized protein LOC100263840 isoform X2 n=1 Tax=Vitis vinifera TaxID=29760 RepID=UPI0005402126|nr:uncharacterized protein LOC100263840 isoform X2 [Vitis vinifera]|eukprot:XP_010663450.1 PREDICTED: uncharacterized protein LOC100263840 isoform X2 [Vitis vinifera]
MDLEVAPCDASSSLCAQKKRKKHKQRHNSMENNHTDHGHREGTSSMENRPLGSDSPQEPPDNSSAKLDLEAQLDSDVKRLEKNKGRNKHEKRRYSLKDKALGYGASEEGTSLKNLSMEQKSAVNTRLNLEKTEPSAEVGSSHKKTNKGKRWKKRHNDFKINGTDHDLREGGHVPSTDLTIINHSEKADVSFISYPSSIKNHDDKADDDAALLEMKNDVNINKRKTKIKTYGRRKTRFSNSSESNLESMKEDGNKLARLRVEDGTSVHPLKDIAMEAAFVNCSDSKPTSEKRKKNMVSNLKDATDETSFVKMPVIPAGNSEPVNGVKLDKMKGALQDEAENVEEETEVKEIIPSSSHLGAIKDDVKIVNKEENPPHTSQSLPERAVSCHSRKKLLILDVNGLLADIVPYFVEGYKPDIVVSRKSVFKRPFCDDFLQFCFERFDVGVWSSRTKKNVDMVLEFLMADARHKLLFCWDQSQCTNTGFTTHENPQKPLLLKELRKLWEKHEPNLRWEKGEYNESNTLLLDDSPCKALLNPAYTAIFPYSYEYKDVKDNMLATGGKLRVYLEGLAMADNVQKYVKQNPFGQRAITKSSATWTYYSKVVSKYSYTQEEDGRNSHACRQ